MENDETILIKLYTIIKIMIILKRTNIKIKVKNMR